MTGDDCVLATNTSSLSIDAIASCLRSPSRLVGMHFVNPAAVMRLVEIVLACGGRRTQPSWWRPPRWHGARRRIGQDVNAAVTESVWHALHGDPRHRPSLLQRSLVEVGWLGRTTGRGFYDHSAAVRHESPPLTIPRVGPLRIGPASSLRPLLDRTGAPVQDDAELGRWCCLPSGGLLGLTGGPSAAEEASHLGRGVVLLDLPLDWASTPRIGAAASRETLLEELSALLATASVAVTPLPDVPGLLLARTLALLVDEVVDLAARQGMSPVSVDAAVRARSELPGGPARVGRPCRRGLDRALVGRAEATATRRSVPRQHTAAPGGAHGTGAS